MEATNKTNLELELDTVKDEIEKLKQKIMAEGGEIPPSPSDSDEELDFDGIHPAQTQSGITGDAIQDEISHAPQPSTLIPRDMMGDAISQDPHACARVDSGQISESTRKWLKGIQNLTGSLSNYRLSRRKEIWSKKMSTEKPAVEQQKILKEGDEIPPSSTNSDADLYFDGIHPALTPCCITGKSIQNKISQEPQTSALTPRGMTGYATQDHISQDSQTSARVDSGQVWSKKRSTEKPAVEQITFSQTELTPKHIIQPTSAFLQPGMTRWASIHTTPPSAAAQPVVMSDYSKYKVKTNNLEVPEFCFYMKENLSLRDNKYTRYINPADAEEAANIVSRVGVILSAMMNSCGGVLNIKHVNANNKDIDSWLNTLNYKLGYILTDVFDKCISIDTVGQDVFMYVRKSKFMIVRPHIYCRSPAAASSDASLCRATDIILNREIRSLEYSDKYSHTELAYDFVMPPEGTHIEYTHFRNVHDETVLINKISSCVKDIFSLPNCEGGGCFIVGVDDQTLMVKGVKLTIVQKHLVKDWLKDWLNEADGQKRIWGSESRVATEGVDWKLTYIPVADHPDGSDHYVLELALYQCPGGVFTKSPEFYTVNRLGDIIRQPHFSLIDLLALSQTHAPSVEPVQRGSTIPAFTSATRTPPSRTTSAYTQHLPLFSRARWRQCRDYWELLAGSAEPTYRIPPELLQVKNHLQIYGEKNLLEDPSGDFLKQFCDQLSSHFQSAGWALVMPALGPCMPANSVTVPSDHIYDAVVCLSDNSICLISCFKIPTTDVTVGKERRQYMFQLARLLKYEILFELNNADDYYDVKLDTLISTDSALSDAIAKSPIVNFYHKHINTNIDNVILRQRIELCISSNKTWIRNRLGALKTYYLTEEQYKCYFSLLGSGLGFIEAAPGCGKSIIGNRLCREYGSRKNVLYAHPGEGFLALIEYQEIADIVHVTSDEDIEKVEDCLKDGSYELLIMDDVQAMSCQKPFWEQLLNTAFALEKTPKIVFLCDSRFQDHYGKNTVKILKEALNEFTTENVLPDASYFFNKNMRNSRITHSFLIAQIETSMNKGLTPLCGNDVQGDDVVYEVVENAMEDSGNNNLLQLLDGLFSGAGDHIYDETDVMLLICDGDHEQADKLRQIIIRYRNYRTCRAVDVPHNGMVVDKIDSVIDMAANVCILVWLKDTRNTDNVKFRVFAASRGVMRVILVYPRYFSAEEATKLGLQDLTSVMNLGVA